MTERLVIWVNTSGSQTRAQRTFSSDTAIFEVMVLAMCKWWLVLFSCSACSRELVSAPVCDRTGGDVRTSEGTRYTHLLTKDFQCVDSLRENAQLVNVVSLQVEQRC